MSQEPRAPAPPDEDSTPHPHPTIRLHSTNTNTNVAVAGYTENGNSAQDIHQYPSRRRSLLLSDSEISVLDLGPSLEFEAEEGPLRLREGKHAQRDCRGEDGRCGKGVPLAVPGRQGSIDVSGGGGGGVAVRIISSPLLSPLRTTKKENSGKVRGQESNADKGGEGKSVEEG
ncbi:hypothetical protein Asppvi_007992 [Aspergillus pseudoviridinutans]|uniref:Uncharacterized protein n=1 Tax=Aspergillus pseudoviridinutans TaxID=1517512 RepID=A0A9P3EXJ8_9EURO|nr:uncharacterized protein Asppvi_007992 [Aspergillus pseudoviridinutans]GIJ89063.1 hypothetical protein Asppvi_007992 [Aspergillus pseudoviridinutans]